MPSLASKEMTDYSSSDSCNQELSARDKTEMWFGQYHTRLLGSMTSLIGYREIAEEICQETFLLCLEKADTYHGDSTLYSWLWKIAHNVAISKYARKKGAIPLTSCLEDWILSEDGLIPDENSMTGLSALLQNETVEFVRKVFDGLREEYKEILQLRLIQRHSIRQTSEILGISEGTVKSRLSRAQDAFYQKYEEICPSENSEDVLERPRKFRRETK